MFSVVHSSRTRPITRVGFIVLSFNLHIWIRDVTPLHLSGHNAMFLEQCFFPPKYVTSLCLVDTSHHILPESSRKQPFLPLVYVDAYRGKFHDLELLESSRIISITALFTPRLRRRESWKVPWPWPPMYPSSTRTRASLLYEYNTLCFK